MKTRKRAVRSYLRTEYESHLLAAQSDRRVMSSRLRSCRLLRMRRQSLSSVVRCAIPRPRISSTCAPEYVEGVPARSEEEQPGIAERGTACWPSVVKRDDTLVTSR